MFAEFACGLDTLSDIESAISSETADDSDHSLFIILSVVKEPIQTGRDICKEWDELFDTIEGSSNTHTCHAPSSQQVVGDESLGTEEGIAYLRRSIGNWNAESKWTSCDKESACQPCNGSYQSSNEVERSIYFLTTIFCL